jgi:hypothetical protein
MNRTFKDLTYPTDMYNISMLNIIVHILQECRHGR